MKTPCCQLCASVTSGTVLARLPPNKIAESGTPSGFCQSTSMHGHCEAGAVKREFGCAPLIPLVGVHGFPSQSIPCSGGGSPMPSHQTSPSGVKTTLVKIVFLAQVANAFGFDFAEVPGATPKNPVSGFKAYNRPSSPTCIHAMSSPRVVTFQPGKEGFIIARFVLPHALGNAPAM